MCSDVESGLHFYQDKIAPSELRRHWIVGRAVSRDLSSLVFPLPFAASD